MWSNKGLKEKKGRVGETEQSGKKGTDIGHVVCTKCREIFCELYGVVARSLRGAVGYGFLWPADIIWSLGSSLPSPLLSSLVFVSPSSSARYHVGHTINLCSQPNGHQRTWSPFQQVDFKMVLRLSMFNFQEKKVCENRSFLGLKDSGTLWLYDSMTQRVKSS